MGEIHQEFKLTVVVSVFVVGVGGGGVELCARASEPAVAYGCNFSRMCFT